ncbi:glycine betaine ABC transporter substrate-binding protein [Halochromatium glycolicum]|uniref:Amino acid ABC transporter permease n=1 Tax=Halochromatium glycolicum TaxID=85075 RepID=A0AAJ0X8V1_9GAMM|nr:glycine betaine ABC transporter substrate-binding protein [Halochromatium glycolicum]MBK1704211.1 amino acid ABC transporter permease [Halochromatium glycolicum]
MALGLTLLVLSLAVAAEPAANPSLSVGSKKFTESVILGEALTLLLADGGFQVAHRAGLGGTRILWGALRSGEIDAYPEYTGTLLREILAERALPDLGALRAALAEQGIRMSAPLGFENTYALAVTEATGARLGLETISDLRAHPDLRLGFSSEFLDRGDGWPGLKVRYRLPQTRVQGLDHDLAYRGLATGRIDVTVVYTTDAEIERYGLRLLDDDRGYFDDYQAVLLYRADLAERAPGAAVLLRRFEGLISEPVMASLNGRVKLDGISEHQAAVELLQERLGLAVEAETVGFWQRLWQRTAEHLGLVAVSLSAAILVAVPLGIVAARRPRLGQVLLGVTGVLQTVPSLALFVFLIPLLGIGWPPSVAALFVYSLLPILRNTHAGLIDIPRPIRESADVIGLTPNARLRLVELPLAARAILAGIKTSAVLNVGTATLAALIGAGGYGQPILTGIRLDDVGLIMQGAVPAAGLALAFQGLFEFGEHWVVPRGLRLRPATAGPQD